MMGLKKTASYSRNIYSTSNEMSTDQCFSPYQDERLIENMRKLVKDFLDLVGERFEAFYFI